MSGGMRSVVAVRRSEMTEHGAVEVGILYELPKEEYYRWNYVGSWDSTDEEATGFQVRIAFWRGAEEVRVLRTDRAMDEVARLGECVRH